MHASFTIGPYRFHSIACCVWGWDWSILLVRRSLRVLGALTAGMQGEMGTGIDDGYYSLIGFSYYVDYALFMDLGTAL